MYIYIYAYIYIQALDACFSVPIRHGRFGHSNPTAPHGTVAPLHLLQTARPPLSHNKCVCFTSRHPTPFTLHASHYNPNAQRNTRYGTRCRFSLEKASLTKVVTAFCTARVTVNPSQVGHLVAQATASKNRGGALSRVPPIEFGTYEIVKTIFWPWLEPFFRQKSSNPCMLLPRWGREREVFIDNLLARIHYIIVMIR
jgi:hypothetical protein